MKRIKYISLFFALLFFGQVNGQDTVIYYQRNAVLFSNSYTFIKEKKTDNKGIFRQITFSDDGQYWVGQGTFKENLCNIFLTFDTSNIKPRIEYKINEINKENLIVRWFDFFGEEQAFFSIKYTDKQLSNYCYNTKFANTFIEIPLSELKDNKLSLFFFNSDSKIIDFEVTKGNNEINIYANDKRGMHFYDKVKEKLRKRKNGFITIGMWTKGKKALFLKQEE